MTVGNFPQYQVSLRHTCALAPSIPSPEPPYFSKTGAEDNIGQGNPVNDPAHGVAVDTLVQRLDGGVEGDNLLMYL